MKRRNGHLERLKGTDQTVVEAGEAVVIKTPTGGGYGKTDGTSAKKNVRS